MKVQELRKLLSSSDRGNLEKAFAECYKQLCKGQKEEMDPVLVDILEGKDIDKKKRESTVNFEELEQQIAEFIENAYAQNYFVPNRSVPKSQRPKWRFMVKNFIKSLEKVPLESEYYSRAVKLLADLYHLMCAACNCYLFSTDDPFRSIGWAQSGLFELLVKMTFASGYTRENIEQLLITACSGGLSVESLHIGQELVLLGGLRTTDVKLMAMEEAKKLVEGRMSKLGNLGRNSNGAYDLMDSVNELCGMILLISIELAEADAGIEYYFTHARNHDKEVTLYCILDLIHIMEDDDLWIRVYEYGIRKKIKPRDYLKDKYEKLKRERKG